MGRWVWVDSLLQNTGSNSASPWHGRLLLSAGRPRLAFWDILSDLDDGVGNEPVIFTRQPPGQRRRRSAALLAPLPNVPSAADDVCAQETGSNAFNDAGYMAHGTPALGSAAYPDSA